MDEKPSLSPAAPFWAAVFEASLCFVAIALGWLLGRPPLESFRTTANGLALGTLAVAPLLLLMLLCARVRRRPFSDIMQVVDDLLVPLFAPCTVIEMAALAILAGLGEEMLFRGVLQASLADRLAAAFHGTAAAAPWIAAVAVAILFAGLHAVNRSYALLAGVIGFYLGWLWLATGNLAVPATTHAVYDFLALVYLVKIRRRDPKGS